MEQVNTLITLPEGKDFDGQLTISSIAGDDSNTTTGSSKRRGKWPRVSGQGDHV